MPIIKELLEGCEAVVLKHIAEDLSKGGTEPTFEELEASVKNNMSKVSEKITKLYKETYECIKKELK